MWHPLSRVTWSRLLHHSVDLLKRKTLGLRNQEVSVDERSRAETTPDEEDGRSEVTLGLANHIWGNDRNDSVPEPVRGSRETDATRSDWEREDLADENPCSGTPGGSEEEDEDGDEGDLGVDSGDVVGNWVAGGVEVSVVESDGDTDDADEELADQHAESTPDEERTTTELLDGVEGDGGGADVDKGEDQGDQEGVADSTSRLQERG